MGMRSSPRRLPPWRPQTEGKNWSLVPASLQAFLAQARRGRSAREATEPTSNNPDGQHGRLISSEINGFARWSKVSPRAISFLSFRDDTAGNLLDIGREPEEGVIGKCDLCTAGACVIDVSLRECTNVQTGKSADYIARGYVVPVWAQLRLGSSWRGIWLDHCGIGGSRIYTHPGPC
ncbi:hypothetical protein IWX64_001450 [Arthrobacter sp. CAN_A212]